MTTPKTKTLCPEMFENLGITDRDSFKAWCLKPVTDEKINSMHVSSFGNTIANLYRDAECSLMMEFINCDLTQEHSRAELRAIITEALYQISLLRVDGVRCHIGNVLICAAGLPGVIIDTCVFECEAGNLVIAE